MCVRTQSSEAWQNLDSMKSELVQFLFQAFWFLFLVGVLVLKWVVNYENTSQDTQKNFSLEVETNLQDPALHPYTMIPLPCQVYTWSCMALLGLYVWVHVLARSPEFKPTLLEPYTSTLQFSYWFWLETT